MTSAGSRTLGTVTVTNDGSEATTVTAADITGAGAAAYSRTTSTPLPATLAPGASMTVQVGFDPSSEGVASLQAACLPWFRERDVALLGSDTSNDVAPSQYPGLGINGAIHGVGMGAMGLWLLDNPQFEALATACAERGRWEFLATIAPLKLEHGTGSPVNPLAML